MKSETRWFKGCTESVSVEQFVRHGEFDKKWITCDCDDCRQLFVDECKDCNKEPVQFTIRYTITKEN